MGFTRNFVHNPADVHQASSALWILNSTPAVSQFFLDLDFFHDGRAAVFQIVLPNVFRGIFKAVTDEILAHFTQAFLMPLNKKICKPRIRKIISGTRVDPADEK